jgi:predicted PhzF superfamily epimerase YddE/YHI9
LLAAAQYWLDHGAVEPLVLGMGASRVQAYRRGGSLWLDFAHLAVANTAVPGWVAQFFPCPPASAATTGEPQGYLLLQWPDDFPLQTLPVPGVELGQVSDCALIAWSRCSTGDYSLRYRYFAPQYGVAEDSATGSAMRVLADYCWQYYAMQEVTARQCSPRGGLLLAKADAKGVSIGGKVNTVSMDRAGTRC